MVNNYDEEYKILFIPKVDISWVEKSLGIFDSTEYQRGCDEFDYIDGGVGLKYAPRDDDQKEALRFMTGVAEYSNYKNAKQLSVCLGTGKGKITKTDINTGEKVPNCGILITDKMGARLSSLAP